MKRNRTRSFIISVILYPIYYLLYNVFLIIGFGLLVVLSQAKVTFSDIEAFLHQHWYFQVFWIMISFAIPAVLSMITYNLLMRPKDPTE
ncbi:MAG: hypothetical protein OXH84_05445 [Gammaproteobacteria bacterium]|nr:hypothetical protein [Gammaproteobacteria bacterium]